MQQYGIARSVFYVVRAMPIAKQLVAKHVAHKHTLEKYDVHF
jgi:hypothetical protein